jgi:hypothetical protein
VRLFIPYLYLPRCLPLPPLASLIGLRSRTLTVFLAFFCAILFFFLVLVCCFCCVSDTEQQLMPACNVLFWNQVIQTNQFTFPALRPLIS